MGSPLAPILANLFMESFEMKLMKKYPQTKFWVRFVDDIFALHCLTERGFLKFLNDINSINPKIQITVEREIEGKLHFLDVLVERKKQSFIYVYRKPTFCPRYIVGKSSHPLSQKLAFLHSGIERIFQLGVDDQKQLDELKF